MIERKNNLNLQYNNTAHSSKSSKLSVFRSAVSNGQNTSVLKYLLIGIIALVLFSLVAAPVSAAFPTSSGGNGTVTDPYNISNANDLKMLANDVNGGTNYYSDKYFKVTTDIDLSTVCNATSGTSWTPIGLMDDSNAASSIYRSFEGTFDGNNNTISNLYINTGGDNQGLFGFIIEDCGATIKNINLTGVNVTGGVMVGGLVGFNNDGNSLITNSYVTGKVEGLNHVGGLVGRSYGKIENCYADVTVTSRGAVEGPMSFGGLVGHKQGGNITNSYATGTVTGITKSQSGVGGLVGRLERGTIENCYANVTVEGTGTGTQTSGVGGLVGWSLNIGTIENCYAVGTVTFTVTGSVGNYLGVGGLVGKNGGLVTDIPTITNSFALNPSVDGNINVSRVVGHNAGEEVTITPCYALDGMRVNGDTVTGGGNNGTSETSDNLMMKSTYTNCGWDFTNTWVMRGDVTPFVAGYPIFIWQTKTVIFDSNGGSPVENKYVMPNTAVTAPTAPTKSGYTFGGWYTDSSFTTEYIFTAPVTEDITLYAKWNPASTPTPQPKSSGGSTDTGSGHFTEYPRTITDGGHVSFGTSPIVTGVDMPEGVTGSVELITVVVTDTDGREFYATFEINAPKSADGEKSLIYFELDLKKIEAEGYTVKDVVLSHKNENGTWTDLKTTYLGTEDGKAKYSAENSVGYSVFAIYYTEGASIENSEPNVTATATQTAEPEPTYVEPVSVEPTKTAVPTPEPTKSPVGLVGLSLGLLGAAVVLRRK